MHGMADRVSLADHLIVNALDPGLGLGVGNWLWLRLSDGRVLVLSLPHQTHTLPQQTLDGLTAALADDLRGCVTQLPAAGDLRPGLNLAYAFDPNPLQLAELPAHLRGAAHTFAAPLDAELLALLGDLSRHSDRTWTSVRNYNRLVLLPAETRQHRLQALRRFGALVAPMLLTAHTHPRLGARDAWREHDDEVLQAIDLGRDLIGALAAHYGVGRALVRAPLCQHPWPVLGMSQANMLALLDGMPPAAQPHSPAEWSPHANALDALITLVGGKTHALRLLGAHAFRGGWRCTWAGLLSQHHSRDWPLAQRLLDLRDFLVASQHALQDAGTLPRDTAQPSSRPEDDAESASLTTRLALLWVAQRGLPSLLRASQRWHAWLLQDESTATSGATWPALLGAFSRAGATASECLNAQALVQEGQSMQHCVGTYHWRCASEAHRVLHLSLPGEVATLQLAPRLSDAALRFQQAALLGPGNRAVSRPMQAWALWVLRRVNRLERLSSRQGVLLAAAAVRLRDRQLNWRVRMRGLVDSANQQAWGQLLAHGLPPLTPGWRPGQVLLDAELAGVAHHAAAQCWDKLAAGQLLRLVREPANAHDPLAVRVDSAHGVLGYVPRPRNQRIALALDAGVALQVRLTGLSERATWGLRLWMRIKCQQVETP